MVIVDDSAIMRKLLRAGLGQTDRFEIVATARDAFEAWDHIQAFTPDAITLDIQMPGLDGLVFLERLMHQRPLPVVMVSSLTQEGCEATLRALELGAADFVAKPSRGEGTDAFLSEVAVKLQRAITNHSRPLAQRGRPARMQSTCRPPFVAIGGNSGGIDALNRTLKGIGAESPPIVVSHFLPQPMLDTMLARMQRKQQASIRMANHGDLLSKGTVLWAPPNKHLGLRRDGHGYSVELTGADKVNGCRPSIDYLFRSCVYLGEARFIAILLDGVGVDGQNGLKEVAAMGAKAILQRERPSAYEVNRSEDNASGEQDQKGIVRMSVDDLTDLFAAISRP